MQLASCLPDTPDGNRMRATLSPEQKSTVGFERWWSPLLPLLVLPNITDFRVSAKEGLVATESILFDEVRWIGVVGILHVWFQFGGLNIHIIQVGESTSIIVMVNQTCAITMQPGNQVFQRLNSYTPTLITQARHDEITRPANQTQRIRAITQRFALLLQLHRRRQRQRVETATCA